MRPAVAAAYVVVPAHDEQDRIGACLASVLDSADRLRAGGSVARVGVLVVLDRCTDGTRTIARRLGVSTLAVDVGSVGAARSAGVARVARLAARRPAVAPGAVLVANTDADCVVPPTWLADLVDLARDADLVQGEVHPEPSEMTPESLSAWCERNPAGRGSLHGANLAFRLDAYLAAGGFPPVASQEDLLLVRAMKAQGARAVGGTRVLTSARRTGRAAGGFADYLRELDLELAQLTGVTGVTGLTETGRA